MAQVYRKAAIERLYSPDRLDSALKVTSPMSWLALAAVTLLIAVTVGWSILGRIPVTISAPGIICSPVSTNAVYAVEAGTVDAVLVHPGSELHYDTPVVIYRTGSGEVKTVSADQAGTVTKLNVSVGDEITAGSELLRLSPRANSRQVAVCYVRLEDAKKLRVGMKANVRLSSADSQTSGHIYARVINIDADAATDAGMYQITGSDNRLSESLRQDGSPVVAVTCEFYLADTENGYAWSNSKGGSQDVQNHSRVEVRIITEEVRPISKLFGKIEELRGD